MAEPMKIEPPELMRSLEHNLLVVVYEGATKMELTVLICGTTTCLQLKEAINLWLTETGRKTYEPDQQICTVSDPCTTLDCTFHEFCAFLILLGEIVENSRDVSSFTSLFTMLKEPAKDVLNFDICDSCYLEAFDPRVLPCGHSCCHWCIPSDVMCPVQGCNAVGAQSRDLLPKNWLAFEFSDPKKSLPCHICSFRGEQTDCSLWCESCFRSNSYYYFCSSCFKAEHSSVKDRDHIPVPIEKLASTLPTCSKHNQIENFFCLDENVFLCTICQWNSRHQRHKTKSVSIYEQQLKTDLKSSLAKLQVDPFIEQNLVLAKERKIQEAKQLEEDIKNLDTRLQEAQEKFEKSKVAELVLTKQIQNLPIQTVFDAKKIETFKTRIFNMNQTDATSQVSQNQASPTEPQKSPLGGWNERPKSCFTSPKRLRYPVAIVVDAASQILVVDRESNRVDVFTKDYVFIRSFSTNGSSRKLNKPCGIVFDSDDNLVILNSGSSKIQIRCARTFRANAEFGEISDDQMRLGEMKNPSGIARDREGTLFVSDTGNHRIQIFTSNGKNIFFHGVFGSYGQGLGQLRSPTGITVHRRTGRVLVCDTENQRIHIFGEDKKPISFFPWYPTDPPDLNNPMGLIVCQRLDGIIVLADAAKKRLQLFSHNGEYLTCISAGLGSPVGLAIDFNRNLLVTDSANHNVQVFSWTEKNSSRGAD